MNVRTITSLILAVALMASAAGVCAAEQSGQGGRYPYTGPNTPVMTSCLNTEVIARATAKEATMTSRSLEC